MTDVFIIRGGFFGWEYTHKLLYVIFGLILVIYDWKKNKRKDYLWIFVFGTFLYLGSEIMLFLFGGRVMQDKFLFGIDVTSLHGLTIPLLVVGDVVMLAVIAIFFADRIRKLETRKRWSIYFALWLFFRDVLPYIILYAFGNTFFNISIGDPQIPSRRNMTETGTLIALSSIIIIGIIWLIRTNKELRKRAFYMMGVMFVLMTVWSLSEWFAGQRWIEIGPEEGPWTYASPFLQILWFGYDILVEMTLFTVVFLALPSIFKLIKRDNN